LTPTLTPTFTPTTGCGTSSLSLQLKEYTSCQANSGSQNFEVINTGSTSVSLSQITIKFWVDDTTGQAVTGTVNYSGCFGSGCTVVNGVAVNAVSFSPACGPDGSHQANWEITVSDSDSRTLSAGATWGNIQTAIHLANWANFSNSSIWYSPCGVGGGTAYTNDPHFAVYYQGNLITASGGTPPSCRPLPTCTPHANFVNQSSENETGPSLTPTPERGFQVVAAPNISREGQPIQFRVNLVRPAQVKVALFSVAGEEVYQTTVQGTAGENTISWGLENQSESTVASGLYIYRLEASDGVSSITRMGKVVVLH
jgi:hypothetical protein